ncbi:MAG: hypothetical protein V1720_12665 [bacterium]
MGKNQINSDEILDIKKQSLEGLFAENELDKKLAEYKQAQVDKITFRILLKPLLISFIALVFSFFLDISYVPFLGNITIDFAKALFPSWQPINQQIEPLSFWWMPIITYFIFVGFAFKAYYELKHEANYSSSSGIIDRITGSAMSVIDGISTALPLLGAAILLISIKLGPEIFLGISVPFEIKALIVLALGVLFEPVMDKLGVEFQHIVNRSREIKDRYYSEIQILETNTILAKIEEQLSKINNPVSNMLKPGELESYQKVFENLLTLSKETYKYTAASQSVLEKMSGFGSIQPEHVESVKSLTKLITEAANSLKDEKTISALKSLENIIKK